MSFKESRFLKIAGTIFIGLVVLVIYQAIGDVGGIDTMKSDINTNKINIEKNTKFQTESEVGVLKIRVDGNTKGIENARTAHDKDMKDADRAHEKDVDLIRQYISDVRSDVKDVSKDIDGIRKDIDDLKTLIIEKL